MLCGLVPGLPTAAQQYDFHNYLQQDGLSNLSITALIKDRDGYLWAGTQNGLFRFDGMRFQRFNAADGLTDTYVTSLGADAAGGVWVGTRTHLYRFHDEVLEAVDAVQDARTPRLAAGASTGLSIADGQSLASLDRTSLLAIDGTEATVVHTEDGRRWSKRPLFDARQIAELPSLRAIRSTYATADGEVWLGCGKGLCELRDGVLTVWDPGHGVPEDRWETILRDHRGHLWARGTMHLVELPKGASRFVDRTPPHIDPGLPHWATPLAEDDEGRMLIQGVHGDSNFGLLRWDGRRWQTIDGANGLKSGGVTSILFDPNGDLWSGSTSYGLIHWVGYRHWENWTAAQGLANEEIWSSLRDHAGHFLAGTEAGIAQLAPDGHFKQRKVPGTGLEQQVNGLIEDRVGRVWAGTVGGSVLRIATDGAKQEVVARGMPHPMQMLRDRLGRLWIAGMGGIYVVAHPQTDPAPVLIREAAALMPTGHKTIRAACESPSGALWFMHDSGLLRLDAGGKWDKVEVKHLPANSSFYELVCSRDGQLWVGGAIPGLWRIDPRQGVGTEPIEAHNVFAGDESANVEVLSLFIDSRGWFWMGTDSGVAVWNGRQWRLFNQESGLVWNDVNENAFSEDPDGSMWVGTSQGLSHVSHPESLLDPVSMRASIARIERDGKAVPMAASLKFPWSTSSLDLHLLSLCYRAPSSQQFRYRMVGIDQGWVTSTSPEVRYPELPPGTYRFEVSADNSALHPVSPVSTTMFSITPPWWRTRVFFGLCLLLGIAAVVVLDRARLRYLLAQRERLELLVRERTHELELSREKLLVLATRDPLTNLWNRAAILEFLQRELHRCGREGLPLAVVLADLDHFKWVNDTYGHPAGDAVLREVADRLGGVIRSYDGAGRYGGEELLLVLPGLLREDVQPRLEQVRSAIVSKGIDVGNDLALLVTASFGVLWMQGHYGSVEAVIAQADAALYRAKDLGRDRVEYANELPLIKDETQPASRVSETRVGALR